MNNLETALVNNIDVIILYRPVGQKEYDLIEESSFSCWPPRLPEQPIFYPVTNREYAQQIAERWNTKDPMGGNVGYVTKFAVKRSFLVKYDIEQVGGKEHTELWIPAEDLEDLNSNIVGKIEILSKHC